jgi:hypothetical protein
MLAFAERFAQSRLVSKVVNTGSWLPDQSQKTIQSER